MMDMNIEEARYIICNAYESYRRLLHLPPNFLEKKVSDNLAKEKDSYKSEVARSIVYCSLDIYNEIIEPILEKFPELKDELEAHKEEEFNKSPCEKKIQKAENKNAQKST